MTSGNTWRTAEYRRNRAVILAGHPACAVRGPACTGAATTADHIVSRVQGGDDSLANLRPACAACNGTLGGHLGSASNARGEVSWTRLWTSIPRQVF